MSVMARMLCVLVLSLTLIPTLTGYQKTTSDARWSAFDGYSEPATLTRLFHF
jgi:hypothetical protein